MKILVSERLSEHKYKTPEGYLICTDAVLARTGKQTYTKDEVFGDGDSTEIDVDRPYEQVMNEKTIASFENKPVTFDHPDEDVNVGNYKSYAVGYVRDVHQGKADGQDVILGNLVITDQDAIDAIESGEHTDLSCGYECDIKDDGNGHYAQNNIRGNHVALCKEGRAGNARIVDSVNDDMHRYKFEYDVPFYDRKTDESGYEHYTKTLSGISAYDAAKQLPDEAEIIRVYKDGALLKSFTSRKSGEWHKTGNKGQLKGLDTKDMKDETTLDDAKHDFSWFRGYINANLQNYSINSLINNVKSKKQFLHTNLAGNDGNVYIVIIDGSLDADFDKGSDMWIDIILEKPDGQQKRVMTYKFNSWNECQQIFNSFKRRVRDSIDDASLKDEDSKADNKTEHTADSKQTTLDDALKILSIVKKISKQ